MSQSKGKSRLGFIDAIRGIAACSVMLQHSLYQSGLLGNWPKETLTGFIPNQLELGEAGVVAFFLVSGFVIPLSLEKTNELFMFWVHRILRIYPLYIAIFICTFAIRGGGGINSLVAFVKDVGAHLLFIQEYTGQPGFVGGSWTLSLEMVWYISISICFALSVNLRTNIIVAAGLIISAVASVLCMAGHHLPMGRLSMLICCILGLVCYRFQKGDISKRHFVALACLLGLIILSNILVGFLFFAAPHPTATFNEVIDSWLLAGLIFFVPFALRHLTVWDRSIFAFLGKISFSVYLVHPVILFLMSYISVRGVALIVLTFSLTIFISVFSYRFIESPLIKFGHTINRKIKIRKPKAYSVVN
jgi:peptidoglycan/LPS O-acetylase OafA/YrhL